MKATCTILCIFLLGAPALGNETKPDTTPALSLAPADALLVIYAAKPADLFQHPLLSQLGVPQETSAALNAAAQTFSGPTMFAICGSPINPASIRIELAVQPADGADSFFERLNENLLPGLGKLLFEDATGGVGTSGLLRTIRLSGPVPVVFAAEKSGLIYGSSRRSDVEAWLEGNEMPPRFTDGDDAKRLQSNGQAPPDAFLYVNTRVLMPLAAMECERVMPGLFTTLGLDRFEFGALTVNWSDKAPRARVVLGLADGEGGLHELLAPANASMEIASLVPGDYTFFVRGALDSAADQADRVNSILRVIDPDIVEEFHEECAEFRAEFGFDPVADFLANIVDEWVTAFRIQPDGTVSGFAAAKLADPTLFQLHVTTLANAYDLSINATNYSGAMVFTPVPPAPQFTWAVVGEYLVISDRPDRLCEVIDAYVDGSTLAIAPALTETTKRLPPQNAQFAFVNVAQLSRLAAEGIRKENGPAELVSAFEKLSKTDAAAGVAISTTPTTLAIDLAITESVTKQARKLAVDSIAASLARSRELSRRVVSAANIKGITMACFVYADQHKGAWPESLAVLVDSGSISVYMLYSPYDGGPDAAPTPEAAIADSYYLYRPGTGRAANEVIACERKLRDGGANFAFADGHVEWVSGPRAEGLLAIMQRTAR